MRHCARPNEYSVLRGWRPQTVFVAAGGLRQVTKITTVATAGLFESWARRRLPQPAATVAGTAVGVGRGLLVTKAHTRRHGRGKGQRAHEHSRLERGRLGQGSDRLGAGQRQLAGKGPMEVQVKSELEAGRETSPTRAPPRRRPSLLAPSSDPSTPTEDAGWRDALQTLDLPASARGR